MYLFKILLCIGFLLVLPFVLGYQWNEHGKFASLQDYCYAYTGGWIIMFAVFEVIAIPATFLKIKFSAAALIWGILILLVCIRNIRCILCLQKQGIRVFERMTAPKLSVVGIAVILLVLLQCFVSTYMCHIDDDDAWYVGMAVTSYTTDTINMYSPYTGDLLDFQEACDYILSPLPVFWAMLSKLCRIYPTIFIHSVLPALFISMAYIVYYMLGKQIFREREKIEYFIFFLCVLNIFGFCSTRTQAAMLLLRVWQGKALTAAVLMPVLICHMIAYREKVCKNEGRKDGGWKLLCILTAIDLATSMGVVFGIMMIGIYVCIPLFMEKRVRDSFLSVLYVIPNVAFGILYLMIR